MKQYLSLAFLVLTVSVSAQSLVIQEKVKFLALGDSYTIGQSVEEQDRWPVQLVNRLRNEKDLLCDNPQIIATTGWRTDQLMAAIDAAQIQEKEHNLISLLIGVNNQYQNKSVESYALEFEQLLIKAIHLAGGDTSSVFVVSIPDYGYTPFGRNNQAIISAGLDQFNAVNEAIAKKYKVKYFYITDISRKGLAEPDLVASDGLHPSKKMYAAWVDRILVDEDVTYVKAPITEVRKKKEEASIRIVPNPFHNFLLVQNPGKNNFHFSLMDSCGLPVVLSHSIEESLELDTQALANGTYYYHFLDSRGKARSGKLIKY